MTTRGEAAQRRRESAEATSGQRRVRRFQIQQSLLSIIEGTGKTLGEVQLSEIAAGVGAKGISPANVYTYYATKEEILRDAVEARLGEFMGRIDLHFRRSEAFGAYVERLVQAVLGLWQDNAAVLGAAAGLSACGADYHLWWRRQLAPWAEALGAAVQEARDSGELPAVDGDAAVLADVAAWALHAGCQQVVAAPDRGGDHAPLRRALALTVRRTMGDPC